MDDLPFNRGKLLNIGFNENLKKRCDYVVFHDVDMLPLRVDYTPSDVPIHLKLLYSKEVIKKFLILTLVELQCFQSMLKKVNGYSNEYWGWGFEDDDLLLRLTEQGIGTDFEIHQSEKEFNLDYIYMVMNLISHV